MKIYYDNIIFSLQKAGGISIYWSELIDRLKIRECTTFFEYENSNIFSRRLEMSVNQESNLLKKLVRYLPFTKILPKKAIFHSSYYRVSLQRNVVNITTVHDFTYEYYSSGLARTIHIWQKGLAIKKSEGIICVSENTKNDLVQFYPSVDESKIKVIYNGIGNDFFRMDDALVFLSGRFNPLDAGKYILFVGDRSKYKNFNVVLDVMSELQGYQLVMIGGSELNENEKAKIVRERIDHFHFRGIPSEDLNIIYNNAFCLLYPSLYEGFGIPVVESMKAGCPVICSNLSSLPEVAGHAALLVSGVSVEEIVNAIHKLERLEFRESVISKGLEQAERFSWDKCFRETYQFYVDVWDKKYI